jgi:outer membrane protein X
MKKLMMIACMMLFSTAMFAEKGDMWLGGGFSYGLSSDYKNFGIGVKGQYELLEKFRADAMVDYFFRHEDVSFFDINLNAQYLLGEDDFHYYPLAGFCFLGHSENALGFPSTFKFGFNVGGGAEYNFSDKFKVYGELNYQIVSGWGRVIPSIGVMFAL